MATTYSGYMGEALWIDLTKGEAKPFEISDRDRYLFIGNKGIAAKILWDHLEPGIDPLGEKNLLVVSTSPMTGTGGPCTSRFNVSCKGPLTGGILASNSGGSFGIQLKRAGYDLIVLAGKAPKPVYIEINEEGAKIHDADDLWGLDTEAVQEEMVKRHGKAAGRLVIGPGGENMVRFACIMSGERATGRGGAGAVMGSKNVKAVVANGKKKIPVTNEEYKEFNKSWIKYLKDHPVTGKELPEFGTSGHLGRCNERGVLPTKNYSAGSYENFADITGQVLAEKYLVKNDGCMSCPIRCARVVEIEGKNLKGPEYETVAMFGSNIDNKDLWSICEWNYLMDKLGIDTISTGGVIGFAMELTEKGLLKSDLKWGKTDKLAALIQDIAYRRGLGDDLAEGVMRLAEKFGGSDFAIHCKGLELAAYEPRRSVGHGLGYATSNRGGCHLNSGFMMYFENLGPVNIDPLKLDGKPGLTVFQQNMFDAVSAAGYCIFTTYGVIPGFAGKLDPKSGLAKIVDKTLRISGPLTGAMFRLPAGMLPFHLPVIHHSKALELCTGMRYKAGDFFKAGTRIYTLEKMINVREGLVEDTLPKRLTNEDQIPGRPETKVPLDKLLPKYYKMRGWDKRGIPTAKLLNWLDLDFTVPALPLDSATVDELQSAFTSARQAVDATRHAAIAAQQPAAEKQAATPKKK